MMWIFQESEQKTNRNNEIGIRLTNAYFYQYTLFSEYPIFLCEYDLAVRIHAHLVGDLL